MKKLIVLLLLSISLLTACSDLQSTDSDYPTFEATINRVVDGDTLLISYEGKEERVRLLLVDTPESVKEGVEVQPFAKEASDFVKKLLPAGTKVEVELGEQERDKYDRLLAYVYIDGDMLNEILIQEGYARVGYVYENNDRYVEKLRAAQEEAKEQKVNIWSIDGYVTDKGYNVEAAENSYSSSNDTSDTAGKIKGNVNSKIYHMPDGKNYNTEMKNVIWFDSVEEAEQAGYRAAKE
ncbi:MAG: thermonuclease family protein [Bacillus sp. (in: firmicutes)]